MARKRNRNSKKDNQNQNTKKSGGGSNQIKKQGFGSDLKPTRCSQCRFNKVNEPCYKKSGLLSELEYVDCVPAMIHYSYKKLNASGLIKD